MERLFDVLEIDGKYLYCYRNIFNAYNRTMHSELSRLLDIAMVINCSI